MVIPCLMIGSERSRLPVAAKTALTQRRRDRGDSRLADPTHLVTALDNRDLDHRHLGEPQHRVGVEVGLLHAALLERDFTEQRGSQTKDDAAFHLGDDACWD